MKQSNQIIWVTIFTLVFSTMLCAENITTTQAASDSTLATSTQPIAESDAISEASEPEVDDANIKVEELIQNYLNIGRGKKVREKLKTSGGWLGSSIMAVSVTPENPQWAKHRVMAYEKAVSDIQNQYILFQSQRIKSEKIRTFYKNALNEVPDFEEADLNVPAKYRRVINKLLAATEGKLDEILDELEIDKSQFDAAPEPQRHIMLSESIEKYTIVEAYSSISGMITLQTFEGYNKKKEHSIGVICIVSPNLRQFAFDIMHNRGHHESSTRKGKDLYKLYSKDKELLLNEFGIRKMKDENGEPVLISFGQWSNSKSSGNASLVSRYRAAAKKLATASAKNQIAMYLTGNTMYRSKSVITELFEEAYKVHPDNYKEEDTVNKIFEGINEKSQSRADANISGLTELYSWTIKHPLYGHEIVGVVVKWSPSNEKAARKLKDWKPGQTPKKEIEDTIEGASGDKTGLEHIDEEDY